MAGRLADSRRSGATLDLHVLGENDSGCGGAGQEISCASSDACVRNEERVGGQREGERNVAGAVSGEDGGAGAEFGGGALHFRGCGGPKTVGQEAGGMRA